MTGYEATFDVRRNSDRSYTVTAGNGAHHFDDADQAMAAYATIVRRIGHIETAALAVEKERAEKGAGK